MTANIAQHSNPRCNIWESPDDQLVIRYWPLKERDGRMKHRQNSSDMDNFAATLSQIVHADVTQQALQSPLELGLTAFLPLSLPVQSLLR